jgi:hypothetical protein
MHTEKSSRLHFLGIPLFPSYCMYIQKKPNTTDKGGKLISDPLFSYLLLLALLNSAYLRSRCCLTLAVPNPSQKIKKCGSGGTQGVRLWTLRSFNRRGNNNMPPHKHFVSWAMSPLTAKWVHFLLLKLG